MQLASTNVVGCVFSWGNAAGERSRTNPNRFGAHSIFGAHADPTDIAQQTIVGR